MCDTNGGKVPGGFSKKYYWPKTASSSETFGHKENKIKFSKKPSSDPRARRHLLSIPQTYAQISKS